MYYPFLIGKQCFILWYCCKNREQYDTNNDQEINVHSKTLHLRSYVIIFWCGLVLFQLSYMPESHPAQYMVKTYDCASAGEVTPDDMGNELYEMPGNYITTTKETHTQTDADSWNVLNIIRDHSVYGFSQWEMTFHNNVVSNWLNPYPE